MVFLLVNNFFGRQVRFPAQRNTKPSLGSVVVTMITSQTNPEQMPRWVAEWFLEASEARTRTHVPHHQTEGTVMADDTSEVTAQRMTAAFNAVQDVTRVILGNRAELQLTPIGRQWVEDAEVMKALGAGSTD